MNPVAIDIGTYSLKAISAKTKGIQIEIARIVEAPNQLGMSVPTDEVNKEKLMKLIEAFFTDHSLPKSDVRLAFPESMVSTKVISIPNLTDAELASAIGWQAEQYIPIPKEDLTLEYQVLYRPPKTDRDAQMRVLLVGVRRSVVEMFVDMFLSIGVEPTFLETQTIALLRAMRISVADPVTLTAHLGFSTTDISIVRQGELAFVFSHPQGGMLLTRALENVLGLAIQQAEEYKRTYGLDPQFFEGKVNQALLPGIKNIIDQLRKAMHFYTTQYPQEAVQLIYLSGGSAQLSGLVSYAASNLGVEVLLANPFVQTAAHQIPGNPAAFTVCYGLLQRHA